MLMMHAAARLNARSYRTQTIPARFVTAQSRSPVSQRLHDRRDRRCDARQGRVSLSNRARAQRDDAVGDATVCATEHARTRPTLATAARASDSTSFFFRLASFALSRWISLKTRKAPSRTLAAPPIPTTHPFPRMSSWLSCRVWQLPQKETRPVPPSGLGKWTGWRAPACRPADSAADHPEGPADIYVLRRLRPPLRRFPASYTRWRHQEGRCSMKQTDPKHQKWCSNR